MLSVLIHTLGCKLNQLESEAITSAFLSCGFALTDGKDADSPPSVIVVNTCTVTSKADQKARRVIRKALRDYPDSRVIVTGCYAQLNREDIRGLEKGGGGRLFALAGAEKSNILELPRYLCEKKDIKGALEIFCKTGVSDNGLAGAFQFNPERFFEHSRSFLKIQDGCDKRCTYCRVRLARGASVSLDAEQVLERLRVLEKSHGEAALTGVNICQYRGIGAAGLGQLLEYLLAGTEKIRLRLSSLEPESIDEDFARILSNKRILPHFHLSIQSGSEKILEKMGRGYDAETVRKAAALLRSAKDDPFLACDIITGFPGETGAEFEKTRELCRETDFAWIHVFPYSRRPGTPAWSFPETVQEREVSRRVRILTDFAWWGRDAYVRRWIGREVEVLAEKSGSGKSFCRGVSGNYLNLLVKYRGEKAPAPGTVLRCKILERCPGGTEIRKIKDFDAVAVESGG
jgi:threonylcarbamoyladenosine tRNA methylthiotransferase MtaB